mgnify:CR=1 FL=1|jgi:adenine-specific DNA-methyltransferase
MDKLKMHTVDLAEENYRKLAALFPDAVTETVDKDGRVVRAIDKDVLMQEINTTVVDDGQQRYRFTWPDKNKAILLANEPTTKTLRLEREKSVGRDGTSGGVDSENIYIEGDNLDALKILRETYLGKVKMIYIDPPYNTGNDFIYEDDFSQKTADYVGNSGQTDEEGNRLVQNTESNGRFHTDWLNMIYPRLKIAKDFLADNGLIFISIDDNEVDNLRKICDEIFGNRNFLALLTVIVKTEGRRYGGFAKTHEQVVIYSKDINQIELNEIDVPGKKFQFYDDLGGFNIQELRNQNARAFNSSNRPNLRYPFYVDLSITDKNGFSKVYLQNDGTLTEVYPITINGYESVWRWGKNEKASKQLSDLVARKGTDGVIRIYQKMRKLTEMPKTVLMDKEFISIKGTRELQNLLGLGVFDFPKPSKLIKLFECIGTNESATILDFFSGSATTADALMQLNSEDDGHRKFILVQLPELTNRSSEAYKAGYKTICDIGEERIRRAGKKIKEETGADIDYGFRCFKVDSGNMEDVYYSPNDLKQEEVSLFSENVKPDRTEEDLLFQVMLDLGILLSSKIEERVIAGKKVFSVADGYLMACFDKDVTEETVTAIAKEHPFYAVFRDGGMNSDSVIANFEQIFETYSPETQRRIL